MNQLLKLAAKKIFKISKKIQTNTNFWTDHNVTNHAYFSTPKESLDYFHWRNDQYYKYIEFMPVAGHDDKIILDFGCGPGHDLVGFGVYSKPKKLIGMDISCSSLAQSESRLALHNIKAELIQIPEDIAELPFDNNSIDHIHCSGVLHHTKNPEALLKQFKRILKPAGECRIMVYNYDSLWLHLYVAFYQQIMQKKYTKLDVMAAFSKFTDGEDCPISRVYKPSEFMALCSNAGFSSRFLGAAISHNEMDYLQQYRYRATQSMQLAREHRDFLIELTLDEHGFAMYNGYYAGVDGCYLVIKL